MADIVGTAANNSLNGTLLQDRITGLGGNDTISGGEGTDTAVFSGTRDQYRITRLEDGRTRIQDLRNGSPDGTDTLASIEFLEFAGLSTENPAYGTPWKPMRFGGETTISFEGSKFTESLLIVGEDGALDIFHMSEQTAASSGLPEDIKEGTYRLTEVQFFGGEPFQVATGGTAITPTFVSDGNLDQPSVLRLPDRVLSASVFTAADGATSIRVDSRLIETFGNFVLPTSNVISATGAAAVRGNPVIAQTNDNSFLVAWSVSNGAIVGRFVDSTGSPTAAQFNLGATIAGNVPIRLAVLDVDRYAVAWDSTDDASSDIRMRLFNGSTPLGDAVTINETTAGRQSQVAMAQLGSGTLAIVWRDSSGGSDTIRGRILSETREPLTSEFSVDSDLTLADATPQITALNNGGFAVAWIGDGNIRVQLFAADGAKVGGEFVANSNRGVAVSEISLATFPDGRFAISWTEGSGSGSTIHVQHFDPRSAGVTGTGTVLRDLWEGSVFADRFDGRFGDDIVDGHGGDDVLLGERGADILSGGRGHDTLEGGDGDDFLRGNLENDRLLSGGGNDVVTGGFGADELDGGDGSDKLGGGAGSDYLGGGAGDDILNGGLGSDIAEGGTGDDFYFVDNFNDIVIEQAGEGIDTVQTADFALDLGLHDNVENGEVEGSADVSLLGNELANVLKGTVGNNLLDGRQGADRLEGGAGNDTYILDDTGDLVIESSNGGKDLINSSASIIVAMQNVETLILTGSAGIDALGDDLANTIDGNTGANILNGGGGNDIMRGGIGDDTYVIDSSGDVTTELAGSGNDTVQSSSLSLDLTLTRFANIENAKLAGTQNLSITGDSDANVLSGNSGANTINGSGDGRDTLIGGLGNDTYIVDSVDLVIEDINEGIDTMQSTATLQLSAFVENGTLLGSLNGVSLTGNFSDNRLIGNAGSNDIQGGSGSDLITGGDGFDDFVYTAATDSILTERDRITDFVAGIDDIDLSGLNTGAGFSFRGTQAFTGGEQVRFIQNKATSTTTIEIDLGGQVGADMAITLFGIITLTASDFILG